MKDPIYVVTQEEHDRARRMESALVTSSKHTGILFAGVSIKKHSADDAEYHVTVGWRRDVDIDPNAMGMAAAAILREAAQFSAADLGSGPTVFLEIVRGISFSP